MAGSFNHIMGRDGGWSLIENMGDSYEATEQLLWLILRTMTPADARRLLDREFYPMCRGEKPPDKALTIVRKRMGE